MPKKRSRLNISQCCKFATVVLLTAVLLAVAACSPSTMEVEETEPPTLTVAPTAITTPTAPPTLAPTTAPTTTPEPSVVSTPRPTPNISFEPFDTDSAGTYTFPQVMVDKTSAKTGEPVYFNILTSSNVNSVQTIIDGEPGKVYKEFVKDGDYRIWRATIHFTTGGRRKVQFKCAMASGGTVLIPDSRIRIEVTFEYTAESTSKAITKGKTVTFTLRTPDNIDTIYALVDGVNQNTAYTEPISDEGGVRIWKVNITFFGLGNRAVTFEAHDGSSVRATFPETGITIIVQESA